MELNIVSHFLNCTSLRSLVAGPMSLGHKTMLLTQAKYELIQVVRGALSLQLSIRTYLPKTLDYYMYLYFLLNVRRCSSV